MKTLFPSLLLIMQFMVLPAQNMRQLNREGVKAYKDSSFSQAELSFRKALEADSSSVEAVYNIANTLYKQGKYEEAGKLFEELSSALDENNYLSKINHNLGNSFMKNEQYERSIEAYKNALRLSPGDNETRYNLAYAKAKLKQQQEQQQQQQNQDQDQEQEKKDKEEKQNENKDQQDQQQEQEKQEQEKQEQEKQEQQQQNQDQEEKENKQEQQKAQAMESLSKEDIERLLKAIQQQEKEVQQKLEEEKARAPKTKTEKDW